MCSSSCRSVCLLAPAWLEGAPCLLGLASVLGGPMAPPKCPGPCGGTTLTELTSKSLRTTWRASEGSKWSWCWPGSYKNKYNSASAGGINTKTNTIRRRLAGFVQKHIQFGTDGCIHREINTIRYNSVQFGVQFLHR
jgi:hypothetical protein